MGIFTKEANEFSFVDMLQFYRYREFNEGVIECRDGEFMVGWRYTGIDHESASDEELNYLSTRLNDLFKGLGSGWAMYAESIRVETNDYPDEDSCHFPDPMSKLIDDERRIAVQEQEAHFETVAFLVLIFKPPSKTSQKISASMMENDGKDMDTLSLEEQTYLGFKKQIHQFEAILGAIFITTRLKPFTHSIDGNVYCDFLQLLHYCATGIMRRVRVPDPRITLDCLIAGQDFIPSFRPQVGDMFVGIVSVEGVQSYTSPAMLAVFDQMPLKYRWSTRFIFIDRVEAVSELEKSRRMWKQRTTAFKDQMLNNPNPRVDLDAASMVADSDEALREVQSGEVAEGYYTSVFVLYADNLQDLEDSTDRFKQTLNEIGFGGRIESVNATEGFLGSIPGNCYTNIDRAPINTANLADLLPVASAWPGDQFNQCPFYDDDAPALIQGETVGSTPFRLNLHVADVGHTFIVGPTGTGKSTLLALMVAQHLKYRNAQVFAFDKGRSMYAVCKGVGGNHFDVAAEDDGIVNHQFMPLAHLASAQDLLWAANWVESLFVLQGVVVDHSVRRKITEALTLQKGSTSPTLTEFSMNLQDENLRNALAYYTVEGPAGHILDGDNDTAEFSHFNCIEVGDLMALGEKVVLPVLLYLFRRIELALDGRPTLLVLDECWLMLEHKVFSEMLGGWLRTLRKANTAVVMATQSVKDAADSSIMGVITDSCATKILLPHPSIAEKTHAHFYADVLGLNEREIFLLSNGTPKREYYYSSVRGKRMFQLNLRPKTLAFVGTSSPDDIKALKSMIASNPSGWQEQWIERCTA